MAEITYMIVYLCNLIFYEHLTPNIAYNAQKDEMQGFAYNKQKRFAN